MTPVPGDAVEKVADEIGQICGLVVEAGYPSDGTRRILAQGILDAIGYDALRSELAAARDVVEAAYRLVPEAQMVCDIARADYGMTPNSLQVTINRARDALARLDSIEPQEGEQ